MRKDNFPDADRPGQLLRILNTQVDPDDTVRKNKILRLLLGEMGENVRIRLPFHCYLGRNLFMEDHVFVNANCHFLDDTSIRIGRETLIAPDVKMYTSYHSREECGPGEPIRYRTEYGPVTVGERCWIGGGAILLPGVTIGNDTTIGAGSVVVKSIPERCIAVGNPCRIIKRL